MVADIAQLIRELRAIDPKRRVFGSDSHKYRLRPTLDEATLREFEARHELPLPADYRAFLREIGDGEAGPFYGVETLQDAAKSRDLSRPFALTEASLWPETDEDETDEEQPGVLELCHQGCAIFSYLVVRGPTYGTIWNGEGELFAPTGLSFGDWYRHWAERALRILGNEKLARRVRLGLTRAEVLQITGGDFWRDREWTYDGQTKRYLESSEIPLQLEMDSRGRVSKINPWPFI